MQKITQTQATQIRKDVEAGIPVKEIAASFKIPMERVDALVGKPKKAKKAKKEKPVVEEPADSVPAADEFD